jgi:hypothetical protein
MRTTAVKAENEAMAAHNRSQLMTQIFRLPCFSQEPEGVLCGKAVSVVTIRDDTLSTS